MRQFLEVKGQRVARHIEPTGQNAGRETVRPGDNQSPEDPESLRMGQGVERMNGLIFVHGSIIQHLSNYKPEGRKFDDQVE
jgi:hypothetical protein